MKKIEQINDLTGRLLEIDEGLSLLGKKDASATIFVKDNKDEAVDVGIGLGVAQAAMEQERQRVVRELKSLGIEA